MKNTLTIVLLAVLGSVVLSGCSSTPQVQRYGSVIGLKEARLEEYNALHANAWPGILQDLEESNIQNYSIYLTRFDDGTYYLFSYFEYAGNDFSADMKTLAEDPLIKKWWALTEPMQQPLGSRSDGEWWKSMKEVFHMD